MTRERLTARDGHSHAPDMPRKRTPRAGLDTDLVLELVCAFLLTDVERHLSARTSDHVQGSARMRVLARTCHCARRTVHRLWRHLYTVARLRAVAPPLRRIVDDRAPHLSAAALSASYAWHLRPGMPDDTFVLSDKFQACYSARGPCFWRLKLFAAGNYMPGCASVYLLPCCAHGRFCQYHVKFWFSLLERDSSPAAHRPWLVDGNDFIAEGRKTTIQFCKTKTNTVRDWGYRAWTAQSRIAEARAIVVHIELLPVTCHCWGASQRKQKCT